MSEGVSGVYAGLLRPHGKYTYFFKHICPAPYSFLIAAIDCVILFCPKPHAEARRRREFFCYMSDFIMWNMVLKKVSVGF